MLPTRHFSDLTQPEIAQQLKKNPLVILPAGSVEQHGPHLPTGTDIYASQVIGNAVAERMDGLLLPATPFGVTPMHMPFEGTITLSPDTYMRVVTETCQSTAQHGAKYLLIINWHEGNIPSLAIASEALHREHGMTVLTVQACYVAAELYGHDCGGHSGDRQAERRGLRHRDQGQLVATEVVVIHRIPGRQAVDRAERAGQRRIAPKHIGRLGQRAAHAEVDDRGRVEREAAGHGEQIGRAARQADRQRADE